MNKILINQLPYFKRVTVPKYIEIKIQNVALKHLGLSDMGKLKDRMEGQLYYDNLKVDLMAEFAFEKIIGIKYFDWAKRENKSYKRKQYNFNRKILNIETFKGNNLPNLNQVSNSNIVFAYVNPDNRIYISGLATKGDIKNLKIISESNHHELVEFDKFISLSSVEELLQIME